MKRGFLLAFVIFCILTLIFFYKIFFGFLPIPSDLLIGGYYPWLDYKWGYSVGVPVKNPALSDVISTAYPWRDLAFNLVKHKEVPLWNPYVFSGSPLLANWQVAIFYPLNFLMIMFGNVWGWSLITVSQPLFSSFFMFLLLRTFKLSIISSIFGSIVFAFAGFMMIFLEYNYLQAGIWLPLLILSIESFIQKRNPFWLFVIPIVLFAILTAGNFQISLYSLVIALIYLMTRSFYLYPKKKAFLITLNLLAFHLLGLGLAAIQLIPTFELFMNSIRGLDSNIVQQNFGLIPLKSLITFLIPDFFGNPTTYNFRGFLYHETSGYFGIIPLIFVIYAIFRKRNFVSIFFIVVFFISLFLIFDTLIGKLIFQYKVPFISTSYASRALYLLTFSASILAAYGMNSVTRKDQLVLRVSSLILFTLIGVTLGLLISFTILRVDDFRNDLSVSLRNLVLPIFIIVAVIAFLKIIKNIKLVLIILTLVTVLDLFRFGWKYNPFVRSDLIYPKTPVIDFLIKNSDHYRIEREKTEVLPPNTWIAYQLLSPSGYDPLVYLPYAQFHNVYNDTSPLSGVSRYLELGKYNSDVLDLLGVKYLVVVKRSNNKIDSEKGETSKNISETKFKKVFEDKSTVVLENTEVLPRVLLFGNYVVSRSYLDALEKLYQGFNFRDGIILDKQLQIPISRNKQDKAEITEYKANEVIINTNTKNSSILMLTDTNYPGWKAYINNRPTTLYLADGIFRAVIVPAGQSIVSFKFEPESFKIGYIVSIVSLIMTFPAYLLYILLRKLMNE